MRMWGIEPALLCDHHLLGEHKEMHMAAGCVARGKNIKGFIDSGFLELHNIQSRHDLLVAELQKRWPKHHATPLLLSHARVGKLDIIFNEFDLAMRCETCCDNLLKRQERINDILSAEDVRRCETCIYFKIRKLDSVCELEPTAICVPGSYKCDQYKRDVFLFGEYWL